MEFARVAVTEVAKENWILTVVPAKKKAASTLALSKPDMGPQSRPERPERASQHKSRAPCKEPLRRAIYSSTFSGKFLNHDFRVRVREQLGQLLVKVDVHADDSRDRGPSWSLSHVARHRRAGFSFSFASRGLGQR